MRLNIRPRFIIAALALTGLAVERPATGQVAGDPFGNPVPPRVLILFDSSHSMQLAPTDTDGTLSYPYDDYDPDNACQLTQDAGVVCGSWNTTRQTSNSPVSGANPTNTQCSSKLCSAKQVLTQVLPNYFSLAEMGLGTYYQYTKTTAATSTGASTVCTYDVLAAPGENYTYSTGVALAGPPYSCPVGTGCPVTCTPLASTPKGYSQTFYTVPTSDPATYTTGGVTYTYSSTNGAPGLNNNSGNYFTYQLTGGAKCPGTSNPPVSTDTYLGGVSGSTVTSGSSILWHYQDTIVKAELDQTFCRYYTYNYVYYATKYNYNWTTVGGEYLKQDRVYADSATNWCPATSANFVQSHIANAAGFSTNTSNKCAEVITTGTANQSVNGQTYGINFVSATGNSDCNYPAGRSCYLAWRGFTTYAPTVSGYATSTTATSGLFQANPYPQANCVFTQDKNGGGPPLDVTRYSATWCTGSNGTTTPAATTLYADYYDPSNIGPSHQVEKSGFSWAATSNSAATTAVLQKETGSDNSTHSISFVDIGSTGASSTTSAAILSALKVYNSTLNPTGIRFPLNSDYTPLWGSISNVATYMTTSVLPNDPNFACRKYYLLVITDGQENTPISGAGVSSWDYAGNLYAAVSALRTISYGGSTIDMETFVVGYGTGAAGSASDAGVALADGGTGAPYSSLDYMAQKGGTALIDGVACNPSAGVACTAGYAFSGTSSTALAANLGNVLAKVTAGSFSRTQPVISTSGTRIYEAYANRPPTNPVEAQGNVDAYTLNSTAAVSTPYWQYGHVGTSAPCSDPNCRLNGQSTRTTYTNFVDTTVMPNVQTSMGLLDPATTSTSNLNHLYTAMGTNSADGLTTVKFIRNMDLMQSFVNDQASCTTSSDCPAGLGQTCSATNVCLCSTSANCPNGDVCNNNACGSPKNSRASDIYHSTPAFVGPSVHANNWAGSVAAAQAGYATFKSGQTAVREPTVYVGANDGMLHAIREDTVDTASPTWAGDERWGYVPTSVQSKLNAQRVGHQFTVDGDFAIEDVCTSPCTSATNWKTILVGTLRDGGPYLYALDITDPSNPKWMWDFSSGNLGNSWSAPEIAQLTVDGTAVWSVIVGAGKSTSTNAGNGIFAINALTGAIITDSASSSAYFQLDVAGACLITAQCPSGMICDTSASPKACTSATGTVYPKNNVVARPTVYRPNDSPQAAQAYFGTTQGRMYRSFFQEALGHVAGWKPVRVWDPYDPAAQADIFGDTTTPVTVASTGAAASGSWPLPISQTPSPVYTSPVLAQVNGLPLVIYGTGDITNPTDTTSTNYIFAFRDNNLATQAEGTTAWVKKLDTGEKLTGKPVILGTAVIVGTYVPPTSASTCGDPGHSRIYAFDAVSGTPVAVLSTTGGTATAGAHATTNGNLTSMLELGGTSSGTGGGIVSGLQLVGSNIVYSQSNSVAPQAVATGGLNVVLTVKSWRRLR